MKNRDAVLRKLDQLESLLSRNYFHTNRGEREKCYETMDLLKENIEQIKTYINSEPIINNELNRS